LIREKSHYTILPLESKNKESAQIPCFWIFKNEFLNLEENLEEKSGFFWKRSGLLLTNKVMVCKLHDGWRVGNVLFACPKERLAC
jgi:hypothetical protein